MKTRITASLQTRTRTRTFTFAFTLAIALAALSITVAPAAAQSVHTLSADFVDRVTGPSDPFTMTVTMSPNDIDISGMAIIVAYDNTQVSLDDVSDNTGQASFPDYILGDKRPLVGIPNVNEYRSVTMSTAFLLMEPVDLALLHFTSTPTYSDPNNRVWIHMDGYSSIEGQANGLFDNTFESIPTAYNNQDTPVPITLSSFSLE